MSICRSCLRVSTCFGSHAAVRTHIMHAPTLLASPVFPAAAFPVFRARRRYCAPERARASVSGESCLATKATDVWSIGMVLFWLLTGQVGLI